MASESNIVAVYKSHSGLQTALEALQRSGFSMMKVSVVGKDGHPGDKAAPYSESDVRRNYWGEMSTFWTGLWRLLDGAAFLLVPGVGPILVAGPFAALLGGGIKEKSLETRPRVLARALMSMGISKNSILRYEAAMETGSLLLVAQGQFGETAKAMEILTATNPSDLAQDDIGLKNWAELFMALG